MCLRPRGGGSISLLNLKRYKIDYKIFHLKMVIGRTLDHKLCNLAAENLLRHPYGSLPSHVHLKHLGYLQRVFIAPRNNPNRVTTRLANPHRRSFELDPLEITFQKLPTQISRLLQAISRLLNSLDMYQSTDCLHQSTAKLSGWPSVD